MKNIFEREMNEDLFNIDFPQRDLDENINIGLAYGLDKHPEKCYLNFTYKTEEMSFHTYRSIRKAENLVLAHESNTDMESQGFSPYIEACKRLLFQQNPELALEGRIAGVQTVSGTEALRLGFELLKENFGSKVYLTNPTYGNHLPIPIDCGFELIRYKYLKDDLSEIDWKSIEQAINKAEKNSIFLLQPFCHNPSGVDPTLKEWSALAKQMKQREVIPFFDVSFLGVKTGDLENDCLVLKIFIEEGLSIMIAHSFSKIMSLYGERIGVLFVVCSSQTTKEKIQAQLENITINHHPTSSLHAAKLVTTVLNTPNLFSEWRKELKLVSIRVRELREKLVEKLNSIRVERNWNVIQKQEGFFTLLPLKPEECRLLTQNYHVYLLSNGRISIGALNQKKMNQLVEGIRKLFTEDLRPKL